MTRYTQGRRGSVFSQSLKRELGDEATRQEQVGSAPSRQTDSAHKCKAKRERKLYGMLYMENTNMFV